MKGDFSRNTFNSLHHFTRVLMQQGRVQLDSDWNELVSILLYQLRTATADIIGDHGGPADIPEDEPGGPVERLGFKIGPPDEGENDFSISQGHYYIDGLLCVNDEAHTYKSHSCDEEELDDDGSFLIYLDVWERHLTHLETNYPIREVALNGPDTASRAQLVCQVKALSSYLDENGEEQETPAGLKQDNEDDRDTANDYCEAWWKHKRLSQSWRGYMKAMLAEESDEDGACVISPESRYLGLENQLYRVEIHQGGSAGEATFKFSRDNGSVIFPLDKAVNGDKIFLKHLGKDDRYSLQKEDWVEVVDDRSVLCQTAEPHKAGDPPIANPLLQILEVDHVDRSVTLSGIPAIGTDMSLHPILRRWDHKGINFEDVTDNGDEAHRILKNGAIPIRNLNEDYVLEEGIFVNFYDGEFDHTDDSTATPPTPQFRAGDYWLIPARVATGDIEWPPDKNGNASWLPPHGVDHYYAPLAIITFDGGTLDEGNIISCQKVFHNLTKLYELANKE